MKIGPYRAVLTTSDFAWTGHHAANEILRPGDHPKRQAEMPEPKAPAERDEGKKQQRGVPI